MRVGQTKTPSLVTIRKALVIDAEPLFRQALLLRIPQRAGAAVFARQAADFMARPDIALTVGFPAN